MRSAQLRGVHSDLTRKSKASTCFQSQHEDASACSDAGNPPSNDTTVYEVSLAAASSASASTQNAAQIRNWRQRPTGFASQASEADPFYDGHRE